MWLSLTLNLQRLILETWKNSLHWLLEYISSSSPSLSPLSVIDEEEDDIHESKKYSTTMVIIIIDCDNMFIINYMYEIQIHLNQTFCLRFFFVLFCYFLKATMFKILRSTFRESIRIKVRVGGIFKRLPWKYAIE